MLLKVVQTLVGRDMSGQLIQNDFVFHFADPAFNRLDPLLNLALRLRRWIARSPSNNGPSWIQTRPTNGSAIIFMPSRTGDERVKRFSRHIRKTCADICIRSRPQNLGLTEAVEIVMLGHGCERRNHRLTPSENPRTRSKTPSCAGKNRGARKKFADVP